MEVPDLLRVIRKRWRIIAAAVLLALAAAGLVTVASPAQYRSTSQLFVSTKSGGTTSDLAAGITFSQRQVKTYADLVTTPTVLGPVIRQLGLGLTPTALAQQITASVPVDTVLINVAVTQTDPDAAVRIADAVARQAIVAITDLETVDSSDGSPVKVTVVTGAGDADQVVPRPARNLALGLALGVLLGMALAALRDRFDTSIKSERDAHEVSDEPIIGAIPLDPKAAATPLIVQADPRSPRAEALRAVRMNLQFVDVSRPLRSFVVTSSLRGEGKSTTSANLALVMAANGSTVCVVEGDLRRPRLLSYLGLDSGVGLTSVLIGEAELDDVLQPFAVDGVTVLGAGPVPPNPSELLGSATMHQILGQLKERFDYVIIDTPPLLPVTDAAVVSRLVDGALVIVGAGVVRREHLARSLGVLATIGARPLGLVVNRIPTTGRDGHTYYGGYPSDEPDDAADRPTGWSRLRRRAVAKAAEAQARAATDAVSRSTRPPAGGDDAAGLKPLVRTRAQRRRADRSRKRG